MTSFNDNLLSTALGLDDSPGRPIPPGSNVATITLQMDGQTVTITCASVASLPHEDQPDGAMVYYEPWDVLYRVVEGMWTPWVWGMSRPPPPAFDQHVRYPARATRSPPSVPVLLEAPQPRRGRRRYVR